MWNIHIVYDLWHSYQLNTCNNACPVYNSDTLNMFLILHIWILNKKL